MLPCYWLIQTTTAVYYKQLSLATTTNKWWVSQSWLHTQLKPTTVSTYQTDNIQSIQQTTTAVISILQLQQQQQQQQVG